MPQASAGQLKMLAITSAQRSTMLPDLKTLKEIGIANVEADAWVGLIAPAGTSEAIVKTLQKAVAEALHDPQLCGKAEGSIHGARRQHLTAVSRDRRGDSGALEAGDRVPAYQDRIECRILEHHEYSSIIRGDAVERSPGIGPSAHVRRSAAER